MAGGARRYARAVFELAREDGEMTQWAERLQTLRGVLADPQVSSILANRSLPLEMRREAALLALNGRAQAGGDNLIQLLVNSGRVFELGQLIEEFERLRDLEEDRVRARVTSAVELEPAERERLLSQLSSRLRKEVRLQVEVDPAILGGLVVQLGDRVIDASVRSRLRQLRRRLAPT
ncbi:MAG TPA: F0F1 ATP synthase subunit delta [Candidatus Nitrosotalea sp.]|nr:F0F1 ATP synthase subunit delta [Candidatus Nitrosotalea sp.]